MSDELSDRLRSELETEGREGKPDLDWVLDRGGRLRLVRRGIAGVSFLVLAVGAWTVLSFATDPTSTNQPAKDQNEDQTVLDDFSGKEVIEKIDEQRRAEVFAFRAMVATGLMEPLAARTFLFTDEEYTERKGAAWVIGFTASDCAPRGSSQTCRPIYGETDEAEMPVPDTYVEVGLENGRWEVVGIDGPMLDEERERLTAYSRPDQEEPSHWEFTAGATTHFGESGWTDMHGFWVGPYPTSAPGSICEARYVDEDGTEIGERWVIYREAPQRELEISGGVTGTDAPVSPAVADVEVHCRQYTGPAWEITEGPELSRLDDGEVVGVGATVTWRGPEGFTSPVKCEATLVDEEGKIVWEGSGRLEALWRPNELKNYPYEAEVFVHTGRRSVEADEIGDFACDSL